MPCSACTDCSCALVVSRLERDMSPKPLVLILPIVSCVQSYLHEYWFLNKFLANGRKNMEKRGNKFFIHDCIYFLQHFCIFLQLMSIFSNPPPHFPPTFPILRCLERLLYSAHTYKQSKCGNRAVLGWHGSDARAAPEVRVEGCTS